VVIASEQKHSEKNLKWRPSSKFPLKREEILKKEKKKRADVQRDFSHPSGRQQEQAAGAGPKSSNLNKGQGILACATHRWVEFAHERCSGS